MKTIKKSLKVTLKVKHGVGVCLSIFKWKTFHYMKNWANSPQSGRISEAFVAGAWERLVEHIASFVEKLLS